MGDEADAYMTSLLSMVCNDMGVVRTLSTDYIHCLESFMDESDVDVVVKRPRPKSYDR